MPKPRDKGHNRSEQGLETTLQSIKRKESQLHSANQEQDLSTDDSDEEDGGEDMLNSDDELERDIAEFNRSLEERMVNDSASVPQPTDQCSKSESDDKKHMLKFGASEFGFTADAVKKKVTQSCVWDQAMVFADQLKLMQILQRLAEHLTAAALSIKQSKEVDAVAIVVAGCICAVADSIMRRRAVDQPSEACSHLMGMLSERMFLQLSVCLRK